MIEPTPIDVPCEFCGAPAGVPCECAGPADEDDGEDTDLNDSSDWESTP